MNINKEADTDIESKLVVTSEERKEGQPGVGEGKVQTTVYKIQGIYSIYIIPVDTGNIAIIF